ncbi:MAG: hypothetical protein COT26_02465 [Candidatus Kerfeldbacteria bacterium CG08_land_8_20_14_0_20_43_14]|uniref:Uncharacterized protein n=1 Tax=Candidatus Kerfeldbacteria bacterium CG08_land_8_20_14_0_20_43_14 TaxID=2014246 RepID=A0A2H0YQ55_9BACT|nr:MAG: hypothetical protein COT26_02465 [Candidatus Kerfeldbacteria bacterium CG08_land_8_20_14_0_20_43_14]
MRIFLDKKAGLGVKQVERKERILKGGTLKNQGLTIGDIPELRNGILQDGREMLDGKNPDCPNRVLADEGIQELTPRMNIKYPKGIRLGTCKNAECGTTKGVRPFIEELEWPQFQET